MPAPGDTDPVDPTVSSNTGAATYRIPIDVPPGPGGLAPQLALTYSSHAGDGPFGVGWRLHLGEIRCTTTQRGAPKLADCQPENPSSPVRYELDGQLLSYNAAQNRWHTFSESFREIKYVLATDSWTVKDPDGTTLRYGSDASSRIPAGSDTARWLLSQIEDAFGNQIDITYSDLPDTIPSTAAADLNAAYPKDITYAGEDRQVHFVYGPRPDPLHDFAGGIERTITRRLKEIQVRSNGALVRKRTFGYDGLEGVSYTTGRSRLAWAQLVGSNGTSALPRQEFRYTDHGLTGSQWGTDVPAWHVGGSDFQLGDVNGDGLLDKVGPGEVAINTGSGWTHDDDWTAALAVAGSAPMLQLEATLAWPNAAEQTNGQASLGIVTAEVEVDPTEMLPLYFTLSNHYPLGTAPPWTAYVNESRDSWSILSAEGSPPPTVQGGLQVSGPGFRVVDLNGDGRADLVHSFSISGITTNLLASGAPATPQYVPGRQALAGYRNTGSEWVRDDSLVGGLPPFASVRVESSEEIIQAKGNYEPLDRPTAGAVGSFQCSDYLGLLGFHARGLDFCLNFLDYFPQFVDLNGDGALDLIALGENPPVLHNPAANLLPWAAAFSRAWIQRPGQTPRWVEAPAFDLPPAVVHWVLHHFEAGCLYDPYQCPGAQDSDAGVRFGDLNRDGLTDLVRASGQGTEVLINRGGGSAVGSAWCSSLVAAECPWAAAYHPPAPFAEGTGFAEWLSKGSLADVNADGWLDVIHFDAYQSGQVDVWLHSPEGIDTPAGGTPPLWKQETAHFDPADVPSLAALGAVDLNGDGAADLLATLSAETGGGQRTFLSGYTPSSPTEPTNRPDLLREIRNGSGGTLTLDYERALQQRNTLLEGLAEDDANPPSQAAEPSNPGSGSLWHLPVLTGVTIEGPNRTPGTTTYAYAHPRFASDTRSSLGFRLIERTRPDGSKVQELYTQSHGRAGRPSQVSVMSAAGDLIFRQWQTWVVPTQLVGGSMLHPEVFVGRPTRVETVRGIFVNTVPGAPMAFLGPRHIRSFVYDDDYGFNFVEEIEEERPTGSLRTVRIPEPASTQLWIRGLVQEETQLDGSQEELSRSAFAWTSEGRLQSSTDFVRKRYTSESPTESVTTLLWDARGNLQQRTDPLGRRTEYCYDGDSGCPELSPPQDTHSVLVQTKQRSSAGVVLATVDLTPDPGSGQLLAVDSSFSDEPRIRLVPDDLGRVIQEWVTPNVIGGSEFLRAETTYSYQVVAPATEPVSVVERREYEDQTATKFVRAVSVGDGFGGSWKSIHERPPQLGETGPTFVGTATYLDPSSGLARETYPIDCGPSSTCAGVTGQEDPALETRRDILGRPVEIESPDGTTLLTYGMLGRAAPGGSQQTLLESVLTQNANGDFTRRLLDGDRLVWVDECTDADPTCSSADRSYYTYEPSGELQAVYDAKVGAGLASMTDAAHKLAYRYDTLGRSWKVEDPDGGISTTVYDAVGRVASTTNARSQVTSFQYDDLDRLTGIDQPVSPQRDYQISYRSTERKPERERILAQNGSEPYSVTWTYDSLGRVFRKAFKTQSPLMTLLLDFGYDELGRTTSVRYPDNATVVRYEYDGAYLKRVCEVTSTLYDCDEPNAVFYVGSSSEDGVAYDHLGRRASVETPAGTRDFAYDPDTQRLATDEFNSKTGGLYHRTLEYVDYDPLGNIVQIDGSSSTGNVDFSASYTYDRRNRLASWQKPGVEGGGGSPLVPPTPKAFFNYDMLGNLTGHAVGSATAANQTFGQTTRPHGVTQRTGPTTDYTYDLDGNLASEAPSTGAARHYTFDALHRLVCVGPAAGGCGTLQVDYDANGSRIFEMYLNSQGSGWTSPRHYAGEYFTLDAGRADFHIFAFGEQIAYKRKIPFNVRTAETWALPWFAFEPPPPLAMVLFAAIGLAGLGLLALRREWAPGLREDPALAAFSLALIVVLVVPPLPARAGGGGTNVLYRRWILGDHLGSATIILKANPLVTTEPQGEVEREVVYKPFGAIHRDEGSQGMDTDTFAGHPRDSTTGLQYMRARWQDPTTGSFLSVDPVVPNGADPQLFNGYSYARNNPQSFIDPDGRRARRPSGAAGRNQPFIFRTFVPLRKPNQPRMPYNEHSPDLFDVLGEIGDALSPDPSAENIDSTDTVSIYDGPLPDWARKKIAREAVDARPRINDPPGGDDTVGIPYVLVDEGLVPWATPRIVDAGVTVVTVSAGLSGLSGLPGNLTMPGEFVYIMLPVFGVQAQVVEVTVEPPAAPPPPPPPPRKELHVCVTDAGEC